MTPKQEQNIREHGDQLLSRVRKLLFGTRPGQVLGVPVFLNRDPRGYALKIDDEWMRKHDAKLYRDWGGYGIIAPDIDK